MERKLLRCDACAGTRRDRVLYRQKGNRGALASRVVAQVLSNPFVAQHRHEKRGMPFSVPLFLARNDYEFGSIRRSLSNNISVSRSSASGNLYEIARTLIPIRADVSE